MINAEFIRVLIGYAPTGASETLCSYIREKTGYAVKAVRHETIETEDGYPADIYPGNFSLIVEIPEGDSRSLARFFVEVGVGTAIVHNIVQRGPYEAAADRLREVMNDTFITL